MATIDQINDLYQFAKELPEVELAQLSIDEVYDRWRSGVVLGEDVGAIQEALDAYKQGERGEPAAAFLARERLERRSGV